MTTRVSSVDVARQVDPSHLDGSTRPDDKDASLERLTRSSASSRSAEDDAGYEGDDECVLEQSHGKLSSSRS